MIEGQMNKQVRCLENYRRRQFVSIAVGTSVVLVWIYFLLFKLNGFVLVFGLPVLVVASKGIGKSVTGLRTVALRKPTFANQFELALNNDRVSERHLLSGPIPDGVMLFFETSRNLIEGAITLRKTTPESTVVTTTQLKPGWRRFAKGSNSNPVEIVLRGGDPGETWLELDLRLYRPNPFLQSKKVETVYVYSALYP